MIYTRAFVCFRNKRKKSSITVQIFLYAIWCICASTSGMLLILMHSRITALLLELLYLDTFVLKFMALPSCGHSPVMHALLLISRGHFFQLV